MDKALAEEQGTDESVANLQAKILHIQWRRVIFDASRLAFIVCSLVFIHAASGVLEEMRLARGELVEQQTAIRMAVQLQGRELARILHGIEVNSRVYIDRFDVQTTHLRGQMEDVAATAAIARKDERKQIVKALQSGIEAQKEAPPPVVVPQVQVVPIPGLVIPQGEQPKPSEHLQEEVPQPPPVSTETEPVVQNKGNPVKRLWNSVRRIF